ncbi:hypothetical protein Tco_0832755, partial [Tanacetum coccineum]
MQGTQESRQQEQGAYKKDCANLDITKLKRKLELAIKEKDEVQLTVNKFENSSKSLSELLYRQIMDKCKTRLGYNAVPPPCTGNFMPPKLDLVYSSLDDFVDVNESVVEKPTVKTNEPKTARKEDGAPIIEEWVSKSKEEDAPKIKTVKMFNKPCFAKINFVKSTKQVKSPRNTSVDKNRQNTPSPRGIRETGTNKCNKRAIPNRDLKDKEVLQWMLEHMTGNRSYLTDYEEIDKGFVAFGGADDEDVSERGIPRVIIYGYDKLPIQSVAPPSLDYIPGPEDPQTPPVPQDEDEREPMFVHAHDPDYVPEPVYPEYIPLEDEYVFPAKEQPLPPVDSPIAESPRYITESDPEEDPKEYEDDETEDDPVDYPIDGGDNGDDDDGDLPEDDADDEDEEKEEHLLPIIETLHFPYPLPPRGRVFENFLAMTTTPSPSPPISLSPPSAGERLVRCMAPLAHPLPPPVPSLLLPSSGCPTQIQTLRIASTQALINAVIVTLPSPPLPPLLPSLYIPPPVDRRDDIPKSEQLPRKRLCLSTLGSKYEIGESSTARPTRDPAEAVPEIAPMTVEEVNTRVTELVELHEYDTQDLYALLEDAQDIWIVDEEDYASHSDTTSGTDGRDSPCDERHEDSGGLDSQHQMLGFQITRMLQGMRTVTRIMAPATRRGPNTTPNNTNPNNMTPESIQAMIDQALLRNSTNGDGSHSSHGDNRRNVQTARPCFYADFMKCQPLNF